MTDNTTSLVARAKTIRADADHALRALTSMDLTSLGDNDTEQTIRRLCARAVTPAGHVAAVCVYDRFAPLALLELKGTDVRVATVCNFPRGGSDIRGAVDQAQTQVDMGVHEVDLVFPHEQYTRGERDEALQLVGQVREVCNGKALLKVILETGALKTPELIGRAARDAILAGADFIKTSTGKTGTGATLEAAEVMLGVIHDMTPETGRTIGFKPSGGIRTVAEAAGYLFLADEIMGPGWTSPRTMRFGASGLLDDVLLHLKDR